jgi:hypothetical protein
VIALALLAAAAQPPVETAERAFASAAQTGGQWAAFRKYAAPDAMMLIDGPQPALPFLEKLKEPPQPVMWWPAHTVTSCDGSLALSTGPWRRRGGTETGKFNTIWRHDASGWHWVFDGGSSPSAAEAKDGIGAGDAVSAKTGLRCRKPVWPQAEAGAIAGGASRDNTLRWRIDKAGEGYRLRVWFNPGNHPTLEHDAIVN